ncbi:hypothetical protein H4Q26_009084 [Puccinia striiformis f. sp. tritici PST-130]|nr:hypothetical protein H4Q26_009084 [Puccinia striiformis f. sp. tritici PST-130]
MTMCVTDSQTFTCYGPESGKAKCKGCNDPDVVETLQLRETPLELRMAEAEAETAMETPETGAVQLEPATANAAPASNDTPSAATGGNSDSSKNGESHNSSTGTVLGSNGFSLAFAALLSSLFV